MDVSTTWVWMVLKKLGMVPGSCLRRIKILKNHTMCFQTNTYFKSVGVDVFVNTTLNCLRTIRFPRGNRGPH